MQNSDFIEKFNNLYVEITEKIDFKGARIEKLIQEIPRVTGVITVCAKRNVKLELYIRQKGMAYYYVTRNGEQVFGSYYVSKFDDAFLKNYQKLVNRVANGDFDYKKTLSDRIAEEVCKRQLTSYMNDTKWKEFLQAMTEEISITLPYAYKTLLEEEPEQLRLGTGYDIESFNWYHFKSLEWVKVKPRFCEYIYKGRLVEDEKIYHDVDAEFVGLMDKYSIPYEYDAKDEVYIIYGYK